MQKPEDVKKGDKIRADKTNVVIALARALAGIRGGGDILVKLRENGLLISRGEGDPHIDGDRIRIELGMLDATGKTPYTDERYWVRPMFMLGDDSTDWITATPTAFTSPSRYSDQYTAINLPEIVNGTHLLPPGHPVIVVYTRDGLTGTDRYFRVFYALASGFAPGDIIPIGGNTVRSGFLECDGTSYLTADYPALAAELNYVWGGAGANFNVPNFGGKALRGFGAAPFDAVGNTGGESVNSHQHHHDEGNQIAIAANGAGYAWDAAFSSTDPVWDGSGSKPAGANDEVTNLGPYGVVKFIIKT